MHLARVLSIASIALGVLVYVMAIAGVLFAKASPPGDIGLVSTCAIFVLGGLAGLAVKPRAA